MKGQQAAEDAAVVSLMLRAGAIPVAISNVPELCMSSDCRNMLYGVTSNPYDTNRSPGGSSGGEGSLLGSAASVVGVGTDFAGSIRLPAYRCGIFGHKPTHGVVPCDGIIPKSGEAQMRLITPGPMCRYAEDLLPVLRVIAGENAAALGLDKPVDLKKLKIYYVVDNGNKYFTSLCKEQSQAVLKAVKCLENLCEAKSQRVTFEEMRRGVFIWIASFGPSAMPFASLFKNFTGSMNPLSELLLKLVGRSHHTMSAIWIALGERLGKGASPVAVEDLVGQGREFVRKLEDLLGDDGVLIFPCSGTKVPYHNQLFSVYKNLPFTCLFNTARMPVTACPLYLDQEGMPVGVQVVAARFKDRLCLAVARELEKEFGGWRPAGTRSCS
ncbi:fatty-acid amide hydrolase 2-B [Ixodes scapularis]|uniref:fatty-acid amide hydrolase 2-B n=1 Tax=Ixodes scapularis TaxID=6945 RepID=UPI001C38F746|nr:fatty-acid amide hydrolase 2-B [Ixodes scapularis]